MSSLVHRSVLVVWLVLLGATVAAWQLGNDDVVRDTRTAAVLILAIGFVKVRLVGRYFMEIRESPIALAAIFDLWLLAVATTVITLHYLA